VKPIHFVVAIATMAALLLFVAFLARYVRGRHAAAAHGTRPISHSEIENRWRP
jgi:hypothetical protein